MNTRTYAIYNELPYSIINGRFGRYIKCFGNKSEAKWEGVKDLTVEEYQAIWSAYRENIKQQEEVYRLQKLEDRAQQVEICLNSEPLTVGEGNNLWDCITNIVGGMTDAYHGCGKITAYISEGKIIAFHYGFEQPINVPVGAQPIQCTVSCYQILF